MRFEPDWQFVLREGLDRIVQFKKLDDCIRVTTHCMYPSNGLVTVNVRGGAHSVVVSDEGGAMSEVLSAGIVKRLNDLQISNLVSPQGLYVREGMIFSPTVSIDAAAAAVLLVANAAKEIAEWHYEHAKIRTPRNFKKALADILQHTFEEKLTHDDVIQGAFKAHKFANVVTFKDGIRIIIDPVEREGSSINSRVVANLDVRQLGDPLVKQHLIYDDDAEWSPDDLGLLGIVGVPVIAFSNSRSVISRIAQNGSIGIQ